MIKSAVFIFSILCLSACNAQEQPPVSGQRVGGPCEGCEAIYEYGDRILASTDTLPGFQENEPKIKITGTVYRNDGRSPAKDVVIYMYHTDRQGIYAQSNAPQGWERRHGMYRGWVKTGDGGKYTFYTFRPASYPGRDEPEHIHFTVKEPGKNEYYIDDIVFDDDPLLTPEKRNLKKNRAGSGIVKPEKENDYYLVKRDIVLGKNIPDY